MESVLNLLIENKNFFINGGASIAISREVRQCPMPPHRHEFRELVIILSGECLHNYNGKRFRIGRGHVLFIDEQSYHAYEDPKCLNLVNILINTEAVLRMERDLAQLPGYAVLFNNKRHNLCGERCLDDKHLDQVLRWIDCIDEEAPSRDQFASFIVMEAYLTLILSLILRYFTKHNVERGETNKFNAAISWMDANLHLPLIVPQLAERAGMSERSFYRKFREVYAVSPAQYILKVRLQRASLLLKHESLSCEEVAFRCGFNNSSYFSTCFCSQFGQTPSKYRQSLERRNN